MVNPLYEPVWCWTDSPDCLYGNIDIRTSRLASELVNAPIEVAVDRNVSVNDPAVH